VISQLDADSASELTHARTRELAEILYSFKTHVNTVFSPKSPNSPDFHSPAVANKKADP
jgi:hypothetical protein